MEETPLQTTPPVQPAAPLAKPTTPPKSKKPLVVLAIAVLFLIVTGIGMALWYNAAKTSYVQQAAAFEEKAKSTYEFMRDLRERQSQGDLIKATFDSAVASAPQAPKLLGVLSAAPPETEARVEQRKKALSDLESSYLNLIAINKYGEELGEVFNSISGSIDGIDTLKAMAPRVATASAALKAKTPPEGTTELHTKLVDGFTLVEVDFTAAIAAYEKPDPVAYADSIEKLGKDVALLNPNQAFDDLSKAYSGQKDKADAAYEELEKLVGQ